MKNKIKVINKGKFDVYGKIPKDLYRTEKYFIAKLQKPLFGDPQVLIYDESGDWNVMMPYDKTWDDALFGDEVKIYVRACFKKDGMFYIDEIVEEQDF